MKDVPGRGDALLALHAGVGIEEVGDHHEDHGDTHRTVLGELVRGPAGGQQEEREPGNANFRPHLQVERPEAWVEPRSHEEVVQEIT